MLLPLLAFSWSSLPWYRILEGIKCIADLIIVIFGL